MFWIIDCFDVVCWPISIFLDIIELNLISTDLSDVSSTNGVFNNNYDMFVEIINRFYSTLFHISYSISVKSGNEFFNSLEIQIWLISAGGIDSMLRKKNKKKRARRKSFPRLSALFSYQNTNFCCSFHRFLLKMGFTLEFFLRLTDY